MTATLAAGDPITVTWRHRRHLDGVRALAVLLVVLFHADTPGFTGGFVGVDVFFVLSGFVVTGSLLAEHARQGTIRLWSFYARRVRRLLPAASVMLVTLVVVLSAVWSPFRQSEVAPDIAAASLYSSNWWFVSQASDYFGGGASESPVLHFWSLAVEEQFYLLWPLLLLAGLGRVARDRSLRRAVVVVSLFAAASLALAAAAGDDGLLTAYYGTHTRVYQLFAGCLVAMAAVSGVFGRAGARAPARALAGPVAWLSLGALLMVSTDLVAVDPVRRGIVAATATVLLLVSTELAAGGGGPTRLLTLAPARSLGRLSYAVYLWHWPVALAVVGAPVVGGWLAGPVVLAASIVAAVLSDRLVEGPARRLDVDALGPRRVVGAGLAASVAVAAFALVVLGGSGGAAVDWQAARDDFTDNVSCSREDPGSCRVVDGRTPGIALVGDSHAAHWLPAMEGIARRAGLALDVSTIGTCPWIDVGVDRGSLEGDCDEVRDVGLGVLAEDADLVVLSSRSVYAATLLDDDGVAVAADAPGRTELVRRAAARTVAPLADGSRTVVVLGPTPEPPRNMPGCLSDATVPSDCDFDRTPPFVALAATLERAVTRAGGHWIDTADVVCPPDGCVAVEDGIVGWADRNHLSGSRSATLVDGLEAALGPVWTPTRAG